MGVRVPGVVLLVAVAVLPGQMKMSVRQLVQFVQSSIQLKHEDKKLAAYLKNVRLTEKLDARTVEELQGMGAGPRTVEALDGLKQGSQSLGPPREAVFPPPAPKTTLAPPSAADQNKIIEAAREYALNYTRRLPDFICTQVTRRFVDPTGLEFWQRQDVITTKLTFFEQKEDYKVILVNSRPVEVDYHKLDGSISAGEFGTMMKELFEPSSEADFRWERWATLHGRRAHVYSYRVAQARSKWTISYERSMTITAGYKGLVYVDADTNSVSRIRLEAEQIPASFPVQQAAVELDYDLVEIGASPFMLPLKHTMRMRSGKLLVKNDVEFRMYRKFGAEATITFETPDALSEEALKEGPPK